jgi:hypothetical protein
MAVRTIPAATVAASNPANVAVGSVSITIAVANTPVSATIIGLGLDGNSTVYAFATAQTSTPHLVIASATYTTLFDTLTVWLNRSTIGATEVDYIAWRNY